ncbi:MAG: hypothetical protein J5X21_05380 [Candidatus Accumulibacter sp.]|nr:hypothetical protein [Candidatus Accumulibacter conexus]
MKVFGEERVNSYFSNSQSAPAVAALAAGGYVTTWVSNGQDGSVDGIYAQRMDANGVAIGPEFRVNSTTGNNQTDPRIAALSDGGFVIVWSDDGGADGSGWGVYAQRYSAAGVPQGDEFRINTTTYSTQYQASVAAYAGGFVVTWANHSGNVDTSGHGVFGTRFDNAGNVVQTGGQNEFQVNAYTTSHQWEPDVAAYADGSYVVVWRSEGQEGDGYSGVYGQRYGSNGAKLGGEFHVNSYVTDYQFAPRVATLSDGGFVVVWQSRGQDGNGDGVYGQRYDAAGNAAGGEFRVNVATDHDQGNPDVIGLSTGGFVVTWYSYYVPAEGKYYEIYTREYDAAGAPSSGEQKVNTFDSSSYGQIQPVVADLGQGNYVVVWSSDNQDGSSYGVYQQMFGDPADFTRQANPELADFGGSVAFGENLVNAGLQVLDAAVSLSDADSANFDGGRIELYFVKGGSLEDQLGVVHEGDTPGRIGVSGTTVSFGGTAIGTISGGVNGANLIIDLNANASVDAVEQLIQRLGYGNGSGNPAASREVGIRVSDGDGGSTFGGIVSINVTRELDGTPAAYGEQQVNTYTYDHQHNPEVAKLAGGGYVVVWTSRSQDSASDSDGIYAQRYNASGVAVGPEFRVPTLTGSSQEYAHVAGLSDGGFVITWQDNAGHDGSSWGVFGQRFDVNGVAQGAQFALSSYTSNDQYHDAVSAYAGGFAAVWSSYNPADGGYHDIHLRRFNNDGTALDGTQLLVSTTPGNPAQQQSGHQFLPDIATLSDGDLLVVWRDDNGNDGSSHGVYGRRFDVGTGTFGDSFLVNTRTDDAQYEARVAALSDGGYVVVWRENNQDGSGSAVMAQRYAANDAKVGIAIRVNEYTTGSQYEPDVIGLSSGGFVVSFFNDYYGPDGTSANVYIREYDAAGNPVDGDRIVNTFTANNQHQPAMADLGQGNYVVVWRSDYQDGSNSGIYQQLYGDTTELPRSANPELADFTGTVSFDENAVNAGLQVIDSAVNLIDSDSANFNGGRLDLYYLTGQAAEDQLGVVHQGTGAGQIGVSGQTVSFGGVAIGTISGGANGANLRIDFSSNAATPDAVEALIQRLGYQNADSSPNASRTLGLRVSDGDGGTSQPNVLTINVSAQLDGTPKAHGEERINTHVPNNQSEAAVAALTGGGYVVAWTSDGQDGSSGGIFAQRFNASGVAVGPEWQVNSVTAGSQSYGHVAGLSDGGFVITWQDDSNHDGSGWGVFGQRYDAGGVAQGSQFLVNSLTTSTQYHDTLTAYSGGFATAWSSYNPAEGGYHDIFLQRWDNAGNKVGGELLVSTDPGSAASQPGYQYLPDIAALSDGDLLLVWRDDNGNDGSSHGVYARRFDVATQSFGDTFLVNTGNTSGAQYEPRVAALSDGGYVIVWRDDNQDGSSAAVIGQRYDASGAAVGSQFRVNENTAGGQYQPEVIGLSTGGFVVSFYNDSWGSQGTYSDVYVREYDAAGNPVDGDRQINDPASNHYWSGQSQPALADLGNGNYVAVWTSDGLQDGSGNGIYQQLFGDLAELARQANPDLADFTGTVTFDENAVNAGLQVIDAAVSLVDSDSANFNGGRLDLYYLTGQAAEDQLGVVHQGNAAGQVGVSGSTVSYGNVVIGTISGGANGSSLRIDFTSNAATAEAVEALIQRLGYANTDSSPNASRSLGLRVSDGDGGASQANVLTINVTPQLDGTPAAHGEEQVNTYTADSQQSSNVAKLAGGGYVVTWISYGQDGSSWGIHAQRFNASGVAVGPEFKVNSLTGGEQSWPHVAGLSNGGFLITWQDNNGHDGSGWGVYGQRYDATGAAAGSQFLVNAHTDSTQYHDSVVAYTGGFATVWSSYGNSGGSGHDIYLQRWDDAGNRVLTGGQNEVRISTDPGSSTAQGGNQYLPEVAAQANGNLFVVWTDEGGNDGAGYGVYGRFYNAGSGTFGDPVVVNTTASGSQSYGASGDFEPNVAALSDGGFVVVWPSDSNDGSGWGVMGQRFDASGNKMGGEFRVNENPASNQYQTDVIGLSTGGFVVGFYHDGSGPDGTYYDAYIREFDAAGNPVDGDRKVNTFNGYNYYQGEPALADLGNGNFVVTWASQYQDSGSSYGIYQQLFGDPAELPRQANPVLDDVIATRTLGTAQAATPQIIDADAWVSDSDSANFDGGSLWVYFTSGQLALDVLAVNDEGTGALQIGVSGSNISYGGTVIGTLAGGSAGAPLVISFNASATPEAVRHLVENITYRYDDLTAPIGSRTVAFRLFDGDGGASAPASTTISIEASAPPAALGLSGLDGSVTLSEATAQLGTVVDENVDVTQGADAITTLTVSYAGGSERPEDQLSIRHQGSGAGQVGVSGFDISYEGTVIGTVNAADTGANGDNLVVDFNGSATAQAVERVIENLRYQTSSDGPLASRTIQVQVTDAASATTTQAMAINITAEDEGVQPLFGDEQVNTYEPGDQYFPRVVGLEGPNAGSYVVVWQSPNEDGSGNGVFAQRYNAQGVQVGTEFQANTYASNDQTAPMVASLANGGFLIVWRSEGQDGSSGGVYAQRYGADGAPAGGEFRVSTVTAYDQTHPTAVGLVDGSFVIAWADQYRDTSSYGSYAQRYAADGTPIGTEFELNSYLPGEQYLPYLATLKDDSSTVGTDESGFIAVWESNGQDGSGWGVYAQRFDLTGTKVGSELLVNTATSGSQTNPDVAVLANGHIVVVWVDQAIGDIRGQLYTAAGVTIGGEFTVSSSDFNSDYGQWPHVTALQSGGFVVSWDGYSSPSDSGYGVYAQEFDANGDKVDGPFSLNGNTANNQHYPDIAALTGNNFVAVWMSNYQESDGNSSHGIFQKVFGTPGSITRQASPELIDLDNSVSFNENVVNAAAQLLDPGVRVVDADSANFDGGRVHVSVITGYGAAQAFDPVAFQQDHFSIRNQGSGAGQVGFNSGTGVVTYAGTAIGSIISNGQNGADLVLQFNANASAEAVEAVIENLTYRNSASNPTASRQVSVVVSDGDGGQSAPRVMTINVAAETDGAVALLNQEQRVNTYTAGDQIEPIIAALQGGNSGQYVVVWESSGQDSSGYGVFGQRYDVNGSAIGPEFQVNTHTPSDQHGNSLLGAAGLSTGGFVVAWDSYDQDGSLYGVYAQRYGTDGQPVGSEFLVNTATWHHQFQAQVLGLNGGAFVIAYTDYQNADGDSYGVRVQHYDVNGVAQGAPFTVNAHVSGNQSFPQLARLNDGGYVVVWHSEGQDGSNWSVQARLMNADGTARSGEFQVNSYTPDNQSNPDVAVLSNGDFVVSWVSNNAGLGGWSIMAQRYTAAGVKIGGEVLVNDGASAPSNGDTYSRIAALDNGGYVITWSDYPGISDHEAMAQQFDAAGNKVDAPLMLNHYTSSTQYRPDIAGLTGGRWAAAWQSYDQDGDQYYGIYQNLFGPAGSLTKSAAPVISDLTNSISVLENAANQAAGVLIDPAVSVSDSDSANFSGGRLTVSVISGYNSLGSDLAQNLPLQDHFSVRNQGSGAGQVGFNAGTGVVSYGGVAIGAIVSGFNGQNGVDLVIEFNPQASAEAVEAVIENLSYRNNSSDPVPGRLVSVTVSDGDGSTSAPRTVQINVTAEADGAIPLFNAEQVNTYTTSTQSAPAMAKLAGGGYVTLWQSNGQDGWDYGIFGQRFAADGTRVGNEFRVSDYTPYNQTEAAVAGLTDGGFVAVFRGQYRDAAGDGVIGQRFDANGVKVGSEFLVNTSSGGTQYQPAITALADGGFAVAWYSDGERDGQYYDVFFQRYDAAGQAVGSETRANTSAGYEDTYQSEPAIIQLAGGDILMAWRGEQQDGSSSGVYAQRFSASTGAKLGSEFQLNTYTNDYQYDPKITATANGFVAVWTSRGQDSSYDGIYARLFNNDGSPASNEFRVNDTYYNWQNTPEVATLANGGFVVTWYDNSNGNRILAQQYDALGNRVDGELQLNGPGTSSDQSPAVVALSNGNFAVSWWGYYDASDSGIFQRLVGNPADFPRQAAPQIIDLVSSVTYMENLINDTPQLIDAGVGLVDPDSANFDGGRLDVSYVTPYGNPNQFDIPGINAQDQLGIRNEGTGVGQIGVSGNSVTYNDGTGAVVIGSIVSDGVNGKPLTVVFNANATPDAAEALIENLTYANPLSNPEPSRTVSLSLSDGDGGVTTPRAITINITAQPDGASLYGAEKVVNSTIGGTQENPSIAHLDNGNYVVVWTDTSGQDGSSQGVFARVYDSNDHPLAPEFQVNTTTASTQWQPSVVALQGGGFAVAWSGYNQIGSTSYDVVGRTFDNTGTATSTEFVINNPAATYANYDQSQPALAALQSGGFVALWYANYDQADNTWAEIWGQHFTSAGVRSGDVFKVNTSTGFQANSQDSPQAATLADGRYVVVWRSNDQDGSSAGVYGQRFNADGTMDGAEFRANTYTANGQYQQDVAALNDGGYVVVWGSDSNQDTSGWGVYGQRYDSSGNAVGGEFRVNYTVSGTQYVPAVAALANGGFVVSWTNGDEILFQQYDAAGRKVDSEQLVNPTANYEYSNDSDLVGTPDGGFILTWGGYNHGNGSYDVFLQRYSNQAPQVQDVSVVGPEDAPIILSDDLFASGFFDAEGQTLAAIKIITLPASGVLKLDGVDVTAGQVISVADLAADRLTYQGNLNFHGPDEFRWNGSDGNVFATTSVFTRITVNNVNDGPALEAGVDQTANEGANFSHTIAIGDPDPTDVHLVTVSWVGSGGQSGGYQFTTGSGNPSIGLTLPDDGIYTVTVTANDQQGQANSIETDSFTVTVDNVAPTLPYLSGNNTVEQGQVYTLDLSGPNNWGPVSDPGTDTVTEYRIDWGDGTAVQIIAAASLPPNGEVTHTYAAPGTPTIRVAVVDEDGAHADAGTKAITVAPPAEVIVVDAGADASVNEGALFSRSISFTDPADQDPAGRNVTVDWGDGSGTQNVRIATGQTSFDIQHVFADNRTTPYTVTVTVDDDGFQSDADSFDVTVNNVAPSLSLGGNGSTPEGAVYTLALGSVVDPGNDSVTSHVVHWGDGNTQTFLPGDLLPNREVQHVYNDGDVSGTSRTITVDLVDEDGTHTSVASKSVTVTNVAPGVPLSGADAVNEGSAYVLNVGAAVDPGVDTPTLYRIDWGDGSPTTDFTPTNYANLLAAGGDVSHTYADGAASGTPRTIVMQVLDEDGAHNAGSKSITVNNVTPAIALTGNASVDEGASYTLTLGTVSDPGTDAVSSYIVHWGDGSSDTYGSAGNVTHTYADGAATPTITVDLVDEDGTHLAAGSLALSVLDVAPTANVSGADSVAEGSAYALSVGPVNDPGADSITGYSIDWGDGTVENLTLAQWAAASGSFSHSYADGAATPTITVSATDEDGTHALGSKSLTVNNVAPAIALTGNASVDEGASYTLTLGTVSDPGTDAVSSYIVHWGDGSSDTYGSAGNVTHTYADGAATSTITVDLVDEDGTHLTAGSLALSVLDVAPTANVSGADSVAEGSAYALSVGPVNDPGADSITGYSIDWGDGTVENLTPAQWAAASGSFSHSYADGAATPTITVSATDEDGTHTLGSKSLTVNNVAPAIALTGNASVDEGASYTLTLGTVSDPGTDTVSSYIVHWGDGSSDSYGSAGDVTHTYADGAATPTITVDLVDEDGTHLTAGSLALSVLDVTPTANVSGAGSVAEGSAYALSVGPVNDPGADSITGYSIDWGDGTVENLTPAQWAAASGSFSHSYADGAATPTITVSATDEDGTHTLGSKSLTVNNVAPAIALTGNASVDEGASYTLTLGTVSDPGTDTVSSYIVHWGDGSSDSYGSAGDVTHTYADGAATPTITVDLVDEDGTHLAAGSLAVSVLDVAPTIAVSGAANAIEDTAYTLNLGGVSDPGADTVSSYLVHWGDGTSDVYGNAGDVTHIYADPGNYTISVDLLDEDGTHSNAGSQAVTVNAASATVFLEAGTDASIAEGSTFTRSIAFSDGNDDGAPGWSYSIDYGDGTTASGTTLVKNVGLNHQYADGDANHTVMVTLTDEAGETASDSFLVAVNDVAPGIALTGAASVDEGAAYTLNLGAVSDPGTDTVTGYSIDWGDGTVTAGSAGDNAHVYADGANAYTIQVSVTDEDGTHLAGSKAITVDNVAPGIALTGAASVDEGASYTLNLGAVSDPGTDTVTGYSIDWGDGTVTAGSAGDNAHVYADGANAYTIQVSVTDEDGTHLAGSKAVTVDNVAPGIALTGAASVDEGASYTLNLGAVSDPGTDTVTSYSIDWGDGTVTAGSAGDNAHVYADGANAYTIQVSVTDEDGTHVAGSKAITVDNVAPIVALAGAANVVEDTAYTLTLGAVSDPGSDTVSSYVVNWGDGSSDTYGSAGDVTHIYADPGNYTISVDLVDEDGTHASAGSQPVTVDAASATLSVNAGPDATLGEGDTFTRSIAFSDGNDDGAPGWSYSIDYGDGTTASGSTLAKNVDLNHQYADGDANHTVTVTLTDEAGETASDSFLVAVNDVAPGIALTGGASVDEGAAYTLNLGAVSDPGTDTVTSYSIDWGDGTVTAGSAGDNAHVYADGANAYTIQVSVTDEDGTHLAGSKAVTVNDVAPGIALTGAASVDEGAAYTLNLGAVSDPGADTVSSYAVNWGDGSSDTYSSAGDVTHVYADGAATATITVDLVDEDGTHANAGSKSITVNNVAPTIALAGAASVVEDTAYLLTLGAVTDPGADTVTEYVVDWGDGTSDTYGSAGDVAHTYADPGSYVIRVDLADEDGSHTNAGGKGVTVDAAAASLFLEAGADATLNEGDTFTRTIAFSDGADNGTPGWGYSIDYGDGSAPVTGTTPVRSLDLSHQYADGHASYNVTVTLTDAAGETASDGFQVTANDVAPVIALSGAPSVAEDTAYTLNLGAVSDPGVDTASSYIVHWGDGSNSVHLAQGAVTHTYANPGSYAISVDVADEDGLHPSAGALAVQVNPVIGIGNAVARLTSAAPDAWVTAWSAASVTLRHKADWDNAGENWSAVKLQNGSPSTLAGTDVYLGDLGVSGQTAPTSVIRQEIDGSEGLNFLLAQDASRATLDLSYLNINDDGLAGAVEAGRVQAFDSQGNLVAEVIFRGGSTAGTQELTISAAAGFRSLVLTTGAYDGANFVDGAYVDAAGDFASAPFASGGKLHGSEFLVDAVEFELVPLVGIGGSSTFDLIS